MNCQKFDAAMYDYHYQLLDQEQQQAFETHRKDCYKCQEVFRQGQNGVALLQQWQPAAEKTLKPVQVKNQESAFPFFYKAAIAATVLIFSYLVFVPALNSTMAYKSSKSVQKNKAFYATTEKTYRKNNKMLAYKTVRKQELYQRKASRKAYSRQKRREKELYQKALKAKHMSKAYAKPKPSKSPYKLPGIKPTPKPKPINAKLSGLEKSKTTVKGRVVKTEKNSRWVMISQGSANGIKKGDKFHIYRNQRYINTIVIKHSYVNGAVGVTQKNNRVLSGDLVTAYSGPKQLVIQNNFRKNTIRPMHSHDISGLLDFDFEANWGEAEFEQKVRNGQINIAFPAKWQSPYARKRARAMIDSIVRHNQFNTESYDRIYENPFIHVMDDPLSTFSIDVDTASYSNMRRFLNGNTLPPKDAVRIEEMINYFKYTYPQPQSNDPFSVHTEMASCPWNPKNLLVKIGLQGRKIATDNLPPSNLVFLIDVSGSMRSYKKLELLKRSFTLLINNLRARDRVAIVVYAGASGLVLPSTSCDRKEQILSTLTNLRAGGSTNGGAGIELAYKVAKQNYISNGNNRVILATDGDFNVGTTSRGNLVRLIEAKAKTGVFLTVLGFGMGNYKDATLENLANKGNGNYAYIDSIEEGKKVFVEQLQGTLFTIAKDVKIQVEFNPNYVNSYRLVGYENRKLAHKDFNDDTKDAGEIGAGHTVTAFYEIVTTDKFGGVPQVDPLRYQKKDLSKNASSKEVLYLKLRYKQPQGKDSKLLTFPITKNIQKKPSQDFSFASSVASFGMLLRNSKYKGKLNYDFVLELAEYGKRGNDSKFRQEFIGLIKKAKFIQKICDFAKKGK